jgi:RNA polymerase sigma factor (sigma-70 family)
MDIDIEFPDLVGLYESDLHQIRNLTESQEIWLAIAIDSAKLLRDSLNTRMRMDKEDFEYIYIGLFNKIRTVVDQLQSFADYYQNSSFSLLEGIKLLISEVIEFKNTTVPVKQSIISNLLVILPERANDQLFDLASFLWSLPLSLLNNYSKELREKNNLPPISEILDVYNPLESLEEIKAISDRAIRAREMLINSKLSYVKWFAFKYRNSGMDYEDVIQEGNIGLIKAVDKFDVRRNVRLKTLAVWWIRQSILRAIADNSRIIRLPVHLSDTIQSLKKEYKKYMRTHLEEPSVQAVSELSRLTVKTVNAIAQLVKPPIPLEEMKLCEESLIKYVNSKNNNRILLCPYCYRAASIQRNQVKALIVDWEIPICLDQSLVGPLYEKSDYANLLYKVFSNKNSEDQLDQPFLEQINYMIATALDQLHPRERRILDYRYGFKGGKANTLQEVADKFGVTRERIRQIEGGALEKLTQIFNRNLTLLGYINLE